MNLLKERGYILQIIIIFVLFLMIVFGAIFYKLSSVDDVNLYQVESNNSDSKDALIYMINYIENIKTTTKSKNIKSVVANYVSNNILLRNRVFLIDIDRENDFAKFLYYPFDKNWNNHVVDKNIEDRAGKRFIQKMIEGRGISNVRYSLVDSRDFTIKELNVYSVYLKNMGLIVGTGRYVNDINSNSMTQTIIKEAFYSKLYEAILIVSLITLLFLSMIVLIANKIIGSIAKRDINLERKERNYKKLFDNILNPIWLIDAKSGVIVDMNDAVIDKFNIDREESLNSSIYDFNFQFKIEIDRYRERLNRDERIVFSMSHVMSEESISHFAVTISPIYMDDSSNYLITATDITSDIKSNQKLKIQYDILKTIVNIQKEILSNNRFDYTVDIIFKEIVNMLSVDRVYVCQDNHGSSESSTSQIFEYSRGRKSQKITYSLELLNRWREIFSLHSEIMGPVRSLPTKEREILESRGIESILIVPIYMADKFWGFMGVDDCNSPRIWNNLEITFMKSVSSSFVSAYSKYLHSKELEIKVKNQVVEIRKKDEILIQQSKMASMGEMISNIAHQWRQPLNGIGVKLMKLEQDFYKERLDEDRLSEYVDDTSEILDNMSQTIDDFRNFFTPNKRVSSFLIDDAISDTLRLFGETYRNSNISINILSSNSRSIKGFKNEFVQAILVIMNNSKDAIKSNKIENGKIDISIDGSKVSFADNGGGIPSDIIDRIFEPYFTTKFKSGGTGVGLYMVKMIVENNMNGKISIENIDYGAKLTIEFND